MAFGRAARLAAPAAAVGFSRVAAMALTLGAVTLTFYTLSAADFTLFNLVMFFVALGSAVAAPLNRAFWAANSAERYAPALLSSAGVVVVVMGLGLAVSIPDASPVVRLAIVVAGIIYAVTRLVERYGYGRLLTLGEGGRSIAPIIFFAAADLTVAAVMWLAAYQSLLVRLVSPAALFLLVLSLSSYRSLLSKLRPSRAQLRESMRFLHVQFASTSGLKVIVFGVAATAAAAVDRFLAVHFPLPAASFAAAYLLAVSYAIALQTLMGFLFDLARIHVFHDGEWKPEARQYSLLCVGTVLGVAFLAAAAYPLLVALQLLPEAVGIVLWLGVLARSAALSLVYILNVDHFQNGRFVPMIMTKVVVLLGGITAFFLLRTGHPQWIAGTMLALTGCLVTAALAFRFSRRLNR